MSNCEHGETCDCYRLGYQGGMKAGLAILTAGDNVELILGKSLEDALIEDGPMTVFEKVLDQKNYYEFVVKELFQQAKDPAVLPVIQGINGKWNALGEVEDAIANVFYHFPLPGGSKGRYHDTLCGENIYWSHVAHFREGDTEAERAAVSRVTCPVCLESLETNS